MDHHILCRLPREVNLFFASACVIAHYIGRVMLATIHDHGLCLCPRCLVLKRKLNQLGSLEDTRNRIRKACKYNGDTVREARRLIYELGVAINGAAIQCELKATSAVPTLVSLWHVVQRCPSYTEVCVARMPLLKNSVLISTSQVCSSWTLCTNSS